MLFLQIMQKFKLIKMLIVSLTASLGFNEFKWFGLKQFQTWLVGL